MRVLPWLVAALLAAWAPAVHADDVWEALRAPGSVVVLRHVVLRRGADGAHAVAGQLYVE